MKRIFYIIAILLVILLGTYLQYIYCCNETACGQKKVVAESTAPKKVTNFKDFFVEDGDVSVVSSQNFDFLPSSYTFIRPVGVDLKSKIDQIKQYSSQNPNKHLAITGYYTDFEQNHSLFPNLGIARANAVKKYLVDRGLDGGKLHVKGELTDYFKKGDSPLKGIVSYEVTEVDDKTLLNKLKDLMGFGKQLKKEPITVYFKTGASYINLSQEERAKIQKIANYLDNVKDSRLLIVGHTDNTGDATKNEVLSKKRAEFVKNYFARNGFDSSVIEVMSKGQREPIASNNTEEGRTKNRRVEITLK